MPEQQDPQRFNCLGLDLNRPVDSVKPQKYPFLQNVRAYLYGNIEQREGLTDIAAVVTSQTPVHSARRLNDPRNSTFTRVVGTGTALATGQTAFTSQDTGYSGDPLALVPYQADGSVTSWMYVGDRSRQRKVDASGVVNTIGLAFPPTVPTVVLAAAPDYKTIEEGEVDTDWDHAGTAGAVSVPGFRVDTTVSQILYDTGSTGWATVAPASMDHIGAGTNLTFDPGDVADDETVFVEEIHPGTTQLGSGPATTTITISRILYDSGSSGLCSLVLSSPVHQVQINAFVRNTDTSENARIRAVIQGPDGETSIRLSTPGTWADAEDIEILASFRVYLANTHAAAEDIQDQSLRSTVTEGTGTLTNTSTSKDLDLSLIAEGVPSRPDDYMHISLKVDRPDLITEIKVLLDVDATTNTFDRNYYWRSFRSNDLTPAARSLQSLLTTRSTAIQRRIIDDSSIENNIQELDQQIDEIESQIAAQGELFDADPEVVRLLQAERRQLSVDRSQQLRLGDSQWVELLFRLSDLTRVGTDDSRSLRDVEGIRIVVITTGTVVFDFDSWWIGGGFGPDVGLDDPLRSNYLYRYRARVPLTGSKSNWSPATRGGETPRRQSVVVTPPQFSAPSGTDFATTDFVLDIQRFGGSIARWYYVGTTANVASPSFTDNLLDATVVLHPSELQVNWQPWPVVGLPVSGTTEKVAGTTITNTDSAFVTNWSPGTEILIDGIAHVIYRVISTSRLEVVENAGSQGAVTWEITQPVLVAQPLPCLWGDEQLGAMFACGDSINPGRLYYSNTHNPDSTTELNFIDITSPSEPLQNGVVYNLRSYVFSSERMFQIMPTGNLQAPWIAQEIPGGHGLFSRWAITRSSAPFIAFLGKDGIYGTVGGEPVSLTDADLYNLFPSEGNIGNTINTIGPPNIISAQEVNLRLEYYDDYLYFDYLDTSGSRRTLLLNFDLGAFTRGEAPGGWFFDDYQQPVTFHYGEEGNGVHALLVGAADTTTGHIYQYIGNDDDGTAISCVMETPSLDQGFPRDNKLYGDILVDINTSGLDLSVIPGINNRATTFAAVTVNNATRLQDAIQFGTAWQPARNVSLRITWSSSGSARPKLFIWESRWILDSAPISAFAWETNSLLFGMANFKHTGLLRITHTSSADLTLIATLDGTAQSAITITNSGSVPKTDVFRVPVWKAKLWKFRLSSTSEFRLDTTDTIFQIKEWGDPGPYQFNQPFQG
jgi:hypothetical protein